MKGQRRSSAGYERVKERARVRSATTTMAGQDIGPLPAVCDPFRRARADNDLKFFCEAYFPKQFSLDWSNDHLETIRRIERAVIDGGLFAMAMPRGSGKTTLCQIGACWAVVTGRHQFVLLVNASEEHAAGALKNIKSHLQGNVGLLEDYPEVVYPIRKLEGEARRCSGQRYYGRLTNIGWHDEQIVLPTIPGSPASGALIRSVGLLGSIRGALHVRPDGSSVRPTMVVIDDPQTDGSAKSPSQVQERLGVIRGALLNLAGPGKRISAVMPCTVIQPNDVADQLLDREKHPEWQGFKAKLVYQFPSNDKLWAEYARIRNESLQATGGIEAATQFYAAHRAEMDEGAVVGWPQRFNVDELSAVQHAVNLRLKVGEDAFWSEYQNEPRPADAEDGGFTVNTIMSKLSSSKRGSLPIGTMYVTGFIDVQATLLYWMLVATSPDFTSCVVDYGTWPEQHRSYYTLADAKRTLAMQYVGMGLEARLLAGITALVNSLATRHMKIEGTDVAIPLTKLLIDANWGESTDTVYLACRQSAHRAILTPSHGKAVGASSTPLENFTRRAGQIYGDGWMLPQPKPGRGVRHVVIDTNRWKSFASARIRTPVGDPGSLTLFGPDGSGHRMVADHWCAEYPQTVESKGRRVDEWKAKPNQDNHFWDCLVGSLCAAHMAGARLLGGGQVVKKKVRRSVTYADG